MCFFNLNYINIYIGLKTPVSLYRTQKMLSTLPATSKHFTDLRVMTFVGHADVSGRRPLHPAAELPGVVHGKLAGHPAPENLLVGVPEVLRQESVDDGVDGGVAVGQAVSHHPEHEGGLVQRERAELHP